ncbi:MAG TPA: radical SAM family heme chaperone HemW [Caulobacteraceae bacterium]
MTCEPQSLGVYVHWPYCAKICPYCDFNVVRDRGRSAQAQALVRAIVVDLKTHARKLGRRELTSVFFGGGTPSLMPPEAVAEIILTAKRLWPPVGELEITLEANPADAERFRFAALAHAGVNRLSLGVQSFDDHHLRFLGRDHDAAAAHVAVERALAAFPRVSIDLIYALPDQTAEDWRAMLADAAAMGPEHISAYQLTIETKTAFGRAVGRGELKPPSDEISAELFETTQTVLGGLGFEAYEVSNHALGTAARARHNLTYWRGGDYVGVGPGAHGRLTHSGDRHATESPRRVGDYIARVEKVGIGATWETLTPRDVALERLLMGLRTVEGVQTSELGDLHLSAARMADFKGWLQIEGERLVATARGRPVLDHLLTELTRAA